MLYYYDKFNLNTPGQFFILTGQDESLTKKTATGIKNNWREKLKISSEQLEKIILTYNSNNNWEKILENTNQSSLFANYSIYEIYFEDKTLDAKAKKTITEYLGKTINSNILIIIYAPFLNIKDYKWLQDNDQVQILRLSFFHKNPEKALDLYDFSDLYLQGNLEKTLKCLELIKTTIDTNLILWKITQDVKTWIELKILDLNKPNNLEQNLKTLNIWSKNFSAYTNMLAKFELEDLYIILQKCATLDYWMKTGKAKDLIWTKIEILATSLCLGVNFLTTCAAS